MLTRAARAKIPTIKQNGTNLGYCFVTDDSSRAIAIEIPSKFNKHSRPRLKKLQGSLQMLQQ